MNGKSNMTAAGDKANVEEPMMYATKQVFSYPNFFLLLSVALCFHPSVYFFALFFFSLGG